MTEILRMDDKQLRAAKALIKKFCCNYDKQTGSCIALDSIDPCPCVQCISYSMLCRWFSAAVLPENYELLLSIRREKASKHCAICGKPISSKSNRVKYCPDCAKRERRRKEAKRQRERYTNLRI